LQRKDSSVSKSSRRSQKAPTALASGRTIINGLDENKLFKNIAVRLYLEGNTKEDMLVGVDPAGRPSWFNNQFYFLMTLLCLGWIIRLYLHRNTLCINYYLKKMIIK